MFNNLRNLAESGALENEAPFAEDQPEKLSAKEASTTSKNNQRWRIAPVDTHPSKKMKLSVDHTSHKDPEPDFELTKDKLDVAQLDPHCDELFSDTDTVDNSTVFTADLTDDDSISTGSAFLNKDDTKCAPGCHTMDAREHFDINDICYHIPVPKSKTTRAEQGPRRYFRQRVQEEEWGVQESSQ